MPRVTCYAWLLAVGVTVGAPAEEPALNRYESAQVHMGALFNVVLYAKDEDSANRGFQAVFARIAELDRLLSDYQADSEVSRLSDSAGSGRAVRLSEDLWRVLVRAQQLSEQTRGAFDVTVGPLTKLWRRARRERALPSSARLEQAQAAVGYAYVQLDSCRREAQLMQPGMRLDLGGIAKGYAADEALKVLRDLGFRMALINAGGDIAAGDPPPDRPGWKIALAALEADQPPDRMLCLTNAAVATSGDAWQFVEIDGARYSHILDPRTGLGLTSHSTVSVVAPDCMTADGLASAISVLGPSRGLELAESLVGVALRVVAAADGASACESSRLRSYDWPTPSGDRPAP